MSKGRVLTKKKWRNGMESYQYKGETYVGKIVIKIKKLLCTEI